MKQWLKSATYRLKRFVILPKDSGIVPVNWLSPRASTARFVKLPMDAGIVPESWFVPRYLCKKGHTSERAP